MVKVKFLSDNLEVEAKRGASLMDVCNESGASIPFGCNKGICGTCIVTIVSGEKNISPKSESEAETLETFGAKDKTQRLACQCKIQGDVEIE